MRIAQVAPLAESVPPRTYGGIERVVHCLTEGLVNRGHDVALFASGDSKTSADLVAVSPTSLRCQHPQSDPALWRMRQLLEVERLADKFDLVHFHTDFWHFQVWRHVRVPQLTTMHGRLDLTDLNQVFSDYPEMAVVSISESQRRPLPQANWIGTVYNGLPVERVTFRPRPGNYLAFLGRLTPDKGPEEAIKIAARVGMPLKMAAKIDQADREYFQQRLEPLLREHRVEYLGEAGPELKDELLGNAAALLFPIRWPEPFGLVMIEAMARGTPVVAFRAGAVDEVMVHGKTGFVVDSEDEAVSAVSKLTTIDREACRNHVMDKFSTDKMVEGYLEIYCKLLASKSAATEATMSLNNEPFD